MFIVPRPVKAVLYLGLVLLLLIIVTGHTDAILPKRLATPVSRNSEGWLMALGVCAYVDFVRPRLLTARRAMTWAGVMGVVLLVGGLALRDSPLPTSVVTLNEAVIALAFLVPYLQLPRPLSWQQLVVLPAIALVAALLAPVSAFLTDMAEAVGALILIPLAVDVIDTGLLANQAPRRLRNALGALVLMVTIVGVHLLTPPNPTGWVEQSLYYVQRTNEAFVAAVVALLYYATRRYSPVPGEVAAPSPTASSGTSPSS